jgi:hypothetical protein
MMILLQMVMCTLKTKGFLKLWGTIHILRIEQGMCVLKESNIEGQWWFLW